MKTRYHEYQKDDIHLHHTVDTYPQDEDFLTHAHRNCEIFHFISGKGYYSVEGVDYPLVQGCTLIMQYGEVHKVHIQPDEPYERIVVEFPIRLIERTPWCSNLSKLFTEKQIGKNNYFMGNKESCDYIENCMRRMCRNTYSSDEEKRTIIISNLVSVVCELQHLANTEKNRIPSGLQSSGMTNDIVSQVISYVNAHLTEDWSLDTLEQHFFFSKSYINRAFKQSTGSSVWDYVVLKRLLVARAMLKDGKTATVAATECGFKDYSSFYRQYKRRFGISPIDDRKLVK